MERKFTLSRFLEMLNEWKHTATLFPVICVKWLLALASHSLRRHVSYCRLLIKLSTSRQISIFPKTLNCFFKGKSLTERAGKQSKCTIIPISTWGRWIVIVWRWFESSYGWFWDRRTLSAIIIKTPNKGVFFGWMELMLLVHLHKLELFWQRVATAHLTNTLHVEISLNMRASCWSLSI